MKKNIFIILALLIFFNVNSYASETTLLDMRNKISAESKQIKALLLESKDMVLMSSMWDSCVITMTQLDAYFYMVGIFNTIKKEDRKEDAINYLTNWLNIIKNINGLNIKSLNTATQILEPKTKVYQERLKSYFSELNKKIDSELGKISLLRKSLKIR